MNRYELRFRLATNSAAPTSEQFPSMLFDSLDDQGVAEDVSTLDGAGSYNLWLTCVADGPLAAVEAGFGHLERAVSDVHRRVEFSGSLFEFLSVEVETVDELDEAADPLGPADLAVAI